ncbi:MAG: hypothetical protein JSU68_03310 [Phycisphaerales bacterium]|nr:MAG: hypothetical protein JSU68_03310 [Phycisphaerales bacterium]
MHESLSPGSVALVSVWLLVLGAAGAYRYVHARRRLGHAATRESAEKLGLTFDPQCVRGGVGAFGQLPDGRGVRLYEEHRRGHTGLFPWHMQTCAGSILEVGVEAEEWEQLNADQREAARALMSACFYDSLDHHRDELASLGFTRVALADGMVRLNAGHRLPTCERMVALLEALGRMAAETEKACIEYALSGRRPGGEPAVATSVDSARAADAAPFDGSPGEPGDVAYVPAPWKCEGCGALNPAEMSHCQMCSAERPGVRHTAK